MEVTQVLPVRKPDVLLRLTAEEATDLRAFCGNLESKDVEKASSAVGAALGIADRLPKLLYQIFNQLDDLNY